MPLQMASSRLIDCVSSRFDGRLLGRRHDVRAEVEECFRVGKFKNSTHFSTHGCILHLAQHDQTTSVTTSKNRMDLCLARRTMHNVLGLYRFRYYCLISLLFPSSFLLNCTHLNWTYITSIFKKISCTKVSRLVVSVCLHDLLPGIHYKWPSSRDWLVQRDTTHYQYTSIWF